MLKSNALNKVESAAIESFLAFFKLPFQANENYIVHDRDLTGVGFFTKIKKNKSLFVKEFKDKRIGGFVAAKLNDEVDIGYVFYFDEGCIVEVEGYTYDDAVWPDVVTSIDVHAVSDGN